MSDFKVIDKKGEWVLNTGESRIPDYVRQAETPGEELVIIEPGVPTKIVVSEFLKQQTTLRLIEDPTNGDIVFKEPKAEPEPKAEKSKPKADPAQPEGAPQ